MKQIQLALEAYYSVNGNYPFTDWISSNNGSWQSSTLATALDPYLPTLPVDPVNTASGYAATDNVFVYSYYARDYGSTDANNSHWYMLLGNLENASNEATYGQSSTSCTGQVFTYPAVVLNGNCVR